MQHLWGSVENLAVASTTPSVSVIEILGSGWFDTDTHSAAFGTKAMGN